jgi:mannose-6-phosphate isomerase-like protein (cupin superfamily)
MQPRRIVIGRSPEGRSTVVRDDVVEPITMALNPGGAFYRVWGSDELVTLPSDGSQPPTSGWFPPAGGFRFAIVTFGPEQPMPDDFDLTAGLDEMRQKVPGLLETLDPENPVFHTSDTIDYNFVVSGEIWLELEDGSETLLKAGDLVVQNGTRHAWHNRGSEPCVMVVALIGARRVS